MFLVLCFKFIFAFHRTEDRHYFFFSFIQNKEENSFVQRGWFHNFQHMLGTITSPFNRPPLPISFWKNCKKILFFFAITSLHFITTGAMFTKSIRNCLNQSSISLVASMERLVKDERYFMHTCSGNRYSSDKIVQESYKYALSIHRVLKVASK